MPLKTHFANFYERPRQGTGYLAQHVAYGYSHRIIARGGYESASFTVRLSAAQAEQFFGDFLGTVVQIYVDNPLEPIFEGFVNRLTYRVGSVALTRSLDDMTNRVNVTFWNASAAPVIKTQQLASAPANNTISQAIYGIKEGSIEAQTHYTANVTHKQILANLNIALLAYPQASAASGANGDGILEVELKGLQYMAWDWQNLLSAVTTDLDGQAAMIRHTVGGSAPDNGASIYSLDSTYILANAAFLISRQSQGGNTYLQYLQGIVEAGDGVFRYVFGITTPDPVTGLRYVYYRPAVSSVLYTTNALSDSGRLRNLAGEIVPGYLVKPDAVIRINDILVGWDEAGDDPRFIYIDELNYNGETGEVTYQSADNITAEGAMKKGKRYKLIQARDAFAAQPRLSL